MPARTTNNSPLGDVSLHAGDAKEIGMRELKRIIVGHDLGAGGEVASSSAGAQAARITLTVRKPPVMVICPDNT